MSWPEAATTMVCVVAVVILFVACLYFATKY
jgi:hypothetical protein